jgi:FMN phosphatase YigB (HAD superfamily)
MTTTLYDTDFDVWLQQQVAALRAKDWTALDVDHLAEEIDDLRRSERKAVRSHWRLLWLHLLKWAYEPQGRERYGASWQASIDYTRAFILASVEDSPSLKPELSHLAEEAYPWARQRASKEARLPLPTQ